MKSSTRRLTTLAAFAGVLGFGGAAAGDVAPTLVPAAIGVSAVDTATTDIATTEPAATEPAPTEPADTTPDDSATTPAPAGPNGCGLCRRGRRLDRFVDHRSERHRVVDHRIVDVGVGRLTRR